MPKSVFCPACPKRLVAFWPALPRRAFCPSAKCCLRKGFPISLFVRRAIGFENCALPLPVAEEGKAQFPQPRHWRAAAKQARQWHCGKASKGPCPLELPRSSFLSPFLRRLTLSRKKPAAKRQPVFCPNMLIILCNTVNCQCLFGFFHEISSKICPLNKFSL